MKKLYSLFCALLSLIILCSCNSYDIPTSEEFEKHSQKMGVVLETDKAEYNYPEDKVRFEIVNYGEEIYIYENDAHELQRYVDGRWENAHLNYFITYEYWRGEIETNERRVGDVISFEEHERNNKGLYGRKKPLKKGYYRIVRDNCISNIFLIN